jgi:hypothetical protein
MREIRICGNCKHHNDIALLECEQCGFDISMEIPVDEEALQAAQASVNSEREGSSLPGKWGIAPLENFEKITPIDDKLKIGRLDSPLCKELDKSNFISRNHAQLLLISGNLCVIDASTNGTFVNDVRVPKMEVTVLHEGDTIRFADVSYKVVALRAD